LNPPQPKLTQIRDHWSVNKLVTIDLEGQTERLRNFGRIDKKGKGILDGQTRRAGAFWKDRQEGLKHFGRTDKMARAF
jgi:hypothetical protein